jgi:transposase
LPKIIRVTLTPEQRVELRRRAHQRVIPPRLRDRLEMVRLSDRGWTIPKIAAHLELHEYTVRKYIKAFLENGFAALPDRPIPGRPSTITEEHLQAVEELLDEAAGKGETWTCPQVVRWLEETFQVKISAGRLGVLLAARGFRWKRTKPDVAHKRKDPDLQVRKKADLEILHFCRGLLAPG